MLHVACVRWGQAFDVRYVEILHDMVRRNLPEGFRGRFVCLTDQPDELKSLAGVETQLLPARAHGWWSKIELFDPAAFPAGDQVLYFDLDTVITGALDKVATYPGHFALLRDAYRPRGYQSSVMAWRHGTALTNFIHARYGELYGVHGQGIAKMFPGGDQQYLEYIWSDALPAHIKGRPWPPDMLQEQYPGQFRSYKVECREGVPKDTRVVFFHGYPRPHQVADGWVPQVWRVGGGTAAELIQVPNVAQDILLANAKRAHADPSIDWLELSEPHGGTAVIVGGAPSLAAHIGTIALLQRGGAVVLATNATDKYLRLRGVTPDAHVVLDAKPNNATFYCPGGKKLYASIVDPLLIELAKRDQEAELTGWDPLTEGMPELLAPDALMIGGGSTVGLRAIALAAAMGFRRFQLFGFDSCYRVDAHHAYDQPWNDGERVLDAVVAGRKFKAAAWMVKQAEEFREMAVTLMNSGCELNVWGDGLIPWIAERLGHAEEGCEQLEGVWWPKRDVETRQAVMQSLQDVVAYAELAQQRRCVIQAGGNVGVWAIELAKHFAQVYTFEPDPENWQCLERNLQAAALPNVVAFQHALGAAKEYVALQQVVGNPGATYVAETQGDVEVNTVDSMGLAYLDALILDVEGYEQRALMGAQHTIERCRPSVIVCELKGHGERYGDTDESTIAWLAARGYHIHSRRHRDVVFTRG